MPVASAMQQWKAKSSSTAISPRAIAASMAVKGDARSSSAASAGARSAASPRGFDLDAGAQLHDVEHFAQRRSSSKSMRNGRRTFSATKAPTPWRVTTSPSARRRRHRLAHHGAADPGRGDHFLFGRQPRAGRQLAAVMSAASRVDQLAASSCAAPTAAGSQSTIFERPEIGLDTWPSVSGHHMI